MPNDVTNNPWVLDSTGAVTTDRIMVGRIRWVGATTAAHTAVLKDAAGKVVWADHAPTTNYTSESFINESGRATMPWDGLTVDTIASGKLYVYLL